MNEFLFPDTLCNMANKICYALICQLVFMGSKQFAVLKQQSSFNSLDISKQAVYERHTRGSLKDQRKVRYLIRKGALNSNQLRSGYGMAQNEFQMESLKIPVVLMSAKSGEIVGTFYLEPFQKARTENGCGMKPLDEVVIWEDQLGRIFVFAYVKSTIFKAPCQKLIPKTKTFAKEDLQNKCPVSINMKQMTLDLFHHQLLFTAKEFTKVLLKDFVSADMKAKTLNQFPQPLPCETKEFSNNSDFLKPTVKPVVSSASDNKADSQTSDDRPDCIPVKSVKTCDECRECIKMKKFFDERRFGIMEKCRCVICYGCIRKFTGTSNGVVKGPVRCPLCFVMSDNVASSAYWIDEGERKVEFFKEYSKNLQYTDIKLRLGWTSFATRKNDLWTRIS